MTFTVKLAFQVVEINGLTDGCVETLLVHRGKL